MNLGVFQSWGRSRLCIEPHPPTPSPTTNGSTEGHSERGSGVEATRGEVCTFGPKVKCTL